MHAQMPRTDEPIRNGLRSLMKSKTQFAAMLESTNDPILNRYEFQADDPWKPTPIPHHLFIRDRTTGFSREVHLQIPGDSIGRLDAIVILLADGQLTHLFSRTATDRLRKTIGRPLAFIGLSCNGNGPKRKNRAEEYLGEPGVSLFDNHYDAFIRLMPRIAQHVLGFPLRRHATVVAGFSNGGAFAYRMAVQHPELFGKAVVMSPQRLRKPVDLSNLETCESSFYLAAGESGLERLFQNNARKLKRDLDHASVRNSLWIDSSAAHDFMLWKEALIRGLQWHFSTTSKA